MTEKQPQTFHFFASSFAEWRALPDLRDLIKAMDKEKRIYGVWYLPVPHATDYEINFFQPKVEGAVFLGTYDPRPKSKATK